MHLLHLLHLFHLLLLHQPRTTNAARLNTQNHHAINPYSERSPFID